MKNFEQLGLCEEILKSLKRMNFTKPTPIQAQAIPMALAGKDILGSAQTGTGKTAAFTLPILEAILHHKKNNALILTPTRELAKQVLDVIHQTLGKESSIKTAFIIGGESIERQFQQLKNNPRIIVGTPGRVNDHLKRGLSLKNFNYLVLDETDRMLDMGFGVQLETILPALPEKRQTMLFSATLPKEIIKLSSKYLHKPEHISVGETNVIAPKISQEIIRISHDKKYEELLKQLKKREGSIIIFSKTKYGSERMAQKLCKDGFDAKALHGDLRQNKRSSVMLNFRKKSFRILVATDIAARGLDVPHIEHVINYDLPQVAEDYIHRMGRTARAGAEGSALCFISPEDSAKWKAIERLLNPNSTDTNTDIKKFKSSKRSNTDKTKSDKYKSSNLRFTKSRSDKPKSEGRKFDKPKSDKPAYDKPKSKPSSSKAYSKFDGKKDEEGRKSNASKNKPGKIRDYGKNGNGRPAYSKTKNKTDSARKSGGFKKGS